MSISRHPDAALAAWLGDGPDVLPDDTRQAIAAGIRTARRRRAGIEWPFGFARLHLPGAGLRPLFLALGAIVLLAAAAVVVSSLRLGLNSSSPAALPTTPDAWERVVIETPSGAAEASVVSLAAGQAGLLAVLGEAGPYPDETRLAVSADGRTWTLVPVGRHPSLSSPRSFGYPSVVGTNRGFLLLQLGEVWTSENGYDWHRLAGPATDPDLRFGGPRAAVAGGPGLVGVGGDRAWYSADGSDWSAAAVPSLPAEILVRPDDERYVGMTGVTAGHDKLVAWGMAEAPLADKGDEHLVVPLLWASRDGRTWTSVADPEMASITAVTGGPGGFVAAGQAGSEPAAWFSADGESWERVADGPFSSPYEMTLEAAAATSAGYVVVGGDGLCLIGPCPDQEAAIWTSADGRSWSRVPSDDRFTGARAETAMTSDSHFVIGGGHDGQPAIWISGLEQSASGADGGTAPAPAIPTRPPGQPLGFAGTWEATDHPPDGSHLTMEVIARRNGSYDVQIRDDLATVCRSGSSTMTGVAEAQEAGTIVIAQPHYACDDGSRADELSGAALDEQLRGLSFAYDAMRDALFDAGGLEWIRAAP